MADQSFNQESGPDQGQHFSQDPEKNKQPNDDGGQVNQDDYIEVNGRKYSKEDAIKKITNADDHIKNLEGEGQQYRESLDKLLEKVDRIPKLEEALERAINNPNQHQEERPQEVDVDAIVRQAQENTLSELTKREQEQVRNSNFKQVSEVVQKEFGDNPDGEITKRAQEVGYSFEEAVNLAQSNPKAFYRVMGLEQPKPKGKEPAPASGDLNTAAFQKHNSGQPQPNTWGTTRSTKERVAAYNERLQAKLAEHGLTN